MCQRIHSGSCIRAVDFLCTDFAKAECHAFGMPYGEDYCAGDEYGGAIVYCKVKDRRQRV